MYLNVLLSALFCLSLNSAAVAAAGAPQFELTGSDGMRLSIYSELDPLQINRIHSWHIDLVSAQGAAMSGAQIEVSGGMPDHDHGLPTFPRVTGETAPGRYRLEGMRFHMPGRWQLYISIDGAEPLLLEFEL